jgi:hypothetical protein
MNAKGWVAFWGQRTPSAITMQDRLPRTHSHDAYTLA